MMPTNTPSVVRLPREGRGIGLIEKMNIYNLQDQGMDTVEANLTLAYHVDSRDSRNFLPQWDGQSIASRSGVFGCQRSSG